MALDDAFGGTQVGYQTELANLGVQRSVARLHQAHAADLESQTAERNMANQVMSRMAQEVNPPPQAPSGPPRPGSAQIDQLSSLYSNTALALAKAGASTTSMKLATEASNLRVHAATTLNSEANAALHQLQAKQAQLTRLNQLASSITTPEQFQSAQLEYLNEHPGEDLPPMFRQYNPALFESIRNGTAEGLKRLELERKQLKDKADAEWKAQERKFKETREARLAAQADERIKIRERDKKNAGGKVTPVGFPSTNEQTAAMRAIKDLYPDLPAKELDGYSFDVAAKAKALLKATPGLDASEALEQALASTAGDIKQVEENYKLFGMDTGVAKGPRSTYTPRRAAAPSAPMPLPTSKGDLKSGQIYNTARGPARWNGTAFEKVQ